MKRAILFIGLLLIVFQSSLQAQQQEPLAMEILFQWTAAGGVSGAGIGFALWLTDPGNPNIQLSDQMARGAALGFILGGAYGLFILQRSVIFPASGLVRVRDPLDPRERITSDPVAVAAGERSALSFEPSLFGRNRGFILPLLNIRF